MPWQNPLQSTSLAPSQAASHAPPQAPKEDLPPPPPAPTPKEEKTNTQTALPTFGMIMPIVRGSSLEIEKRQKRDYFKQVNLISVDGPVVKTKWSHMPITFSE
jgi:hypothetical protein